MSALNMRKILSDELKAANAMLAKYEDKALAGDGNEATQKGVDYYRSVAQQLRVQLFDTKSDQSDI